VYLADAHTHLDFPEFDADRDAVVLRARSVGVARWVICGSRHEHWSETERIAAETGGIAILGVHPWSTAELDAKGLAPWLEDLKQRDLRGIGEIGLDTLHGGWENQRRGFRDQLAIARERELPVVLHCVRAYPELLALLERDGVPRAGGMMHAWSGPPDQVARGEPAHLPGVVAGVAALNGASEEEIGQISARNLAVLFGLPD
jgi:TatD DNase family protein